MTHILDKDVEFLAHFGVKGMRWGVHKKTPQSRYKTPQTAKSKAGKKSKVKTALKVVATGALLGVPAYLAVRKIQDNKETQFVLDHGRRISEQFVRDNSTKKPWAPGAKYNGEAADLWAKHEAVKQEFDRWLTQKEADAGYRYQGPR